MELRYVVEFRSAYINGLNMPFPQEYSRVRDGQSSFRWRDTSNAEGVPGRGDQQ